ncbi:MAG: polysaccharide deacetylase [Clostridia bacterium]|nr:polysaccharide deacetylase [Clostridia bacterium]
MKKRLLRIGFCMFLTVIMLFCYHRYQAQNKPVFAMGQENKCIYLTFDDGPSDSTTPLILDTLKEENVKASFFIIGRQAKRRPELLKRIYNEGHTVGIHSYSHDYAQIYTSPVALLEDIEKCSAVLENVLGLKTNLYRFPGGSFSLRRELVDNVQAAGYRYVDWNASCRDAEILNASADELFQAAITTPADRKKIIMLLHDSAHRKNTVEALKMIIRYYKNAGYEFKTL